VQAQQAVNVLHLKFYMYFVYIIKSQKDSTFYTGLTDNVKERIIQHNNGESNYTKSRIPWGLVWVGIFPGKQKAAEFEKYLKSASGIAFRNKHLV
jgi:putative endonuclease